MGYPDRCLICYTHSKRNQSNNITSTGSVYLRNLNVIFVLRSLLEIPQDNLHIYLVNGGGEPGDGWIWICTKCSELVEEAKHLHEEIVRLSRRFKGLKKKVIEAIKASRNGQQKRKTPGDIARLKITDESRNFVGIRKYAHLTDPFKAGDLRACQLATGKKIGGLVSDYISNLCAVTMEVGAFGSVEERDNVMHDVQGESVVWEDENNSQQSGGVCEAGDDWHQPEGDDNNFSLRDKENNTAAEGKSKDGFRLCEHCSVAFPEMYFEQHVNCCHEENESGTVNEHSLVMDMFGAKISCDICWTKTGRKCFSSLEAREAHMELHRTSSFHCFKCLSVFRVLKDLRRHISKYHPEFKSDLASVSSHSQQKSKDTTKKKCETIYIKTSKPSPKKQRVTVNCPKCDILIREKYLPEHLKLHRQSPHHCVICTHVFKTEKDLKRHIRDFHDKLDNRPSDTVKVIQMRADPVTAPPLSDSQFELGLRARPARTSVMTKIEAKAEGDFISGDEIDEQDNDQEYTEDPLDMSESDTEWNSSRSYLKRSRKSFSRVRVNPKTSVNSYKEQESEKKEQVVGPMKAATTELCPFCNKFRFDITMKEKLCEHLVVCKSATTSDSADDTIGTAGCPLCQDSTYSSYNKSALLDHLKTSCRAGLSSDSTGIPLTSRVLECNLCPNKYFGLDNFLKHYIYHEKAIHKCTRCPRRYQTTYAVGVHWTADHAEACKSVQLQYRYTKDRTLPNVPWWCLVCNEKFLEEGIREEHMRTVHHELVEVEKPHVCQECTNQYLSQDELKLHQGTAHISEHRCEVCKQKFSHREMLIRHRRSAHRLNLLFCHICGKEVSDGKYFRKHMRSHLSMRNHVCDDCGQSFKTSVCLRFHKFYKHVPPQDPENPQACQSCNKTFCSPSALATHLVSVHEKNYKLHCSHCPQGFMFPAQLNRHLARNHGIGELTPRTVPALVRTTKDPIFSCSFCGKRFQSKKSMLLHEQVHSNSETKPFRCEVCGSRFAIKKYLKSHLKVHQPSFKERKHVCSLCGKAFEKPKDLRRHELIHANSDNKPYECNLCGQLFASDRYLASHIKHHEGLKKAHHECSHCNKKFMKKKQLTIHLESHTTLDVSKPHQCFLCGKRFSSQRYLISHGKQAHKVNDEKKTN